MTGVEWSRFSSDPRRPEVTSVRATDADRELALTVLREAYADGRLSREEHEQRASQALEVRQLGGFLPLLGDLVSPLPAVRSAHEQAVQRYRRDLTDARDGLLFVGGVTTAIWGVTSAAAGELLFFWPVFPIVAIAMGWVLTRINGEDRIAEHQRRIEKRQRRRERRRPDSES